MMGTRYITAGEGARAALPWSTVNPTPIVETMEDPERYRLYRLCPCEECGGTGKQRNWADHAEKRRCPVCRGEGRKLDLVATAGSPEAVGVALVTLTSEGEFEECPFGLMDRPQGEKGRWLLLPWGPSARNISDAGKTLRSARRT